MNARLCSLLVAGGVVLAGIQAGSLHGAVLDAVNASPVATLKGATFLPVPGGNLLQLTIPGFQGVPQVQLLAKPYTRSQLRELLSTWL